MTSPNFTYTPPFTHPSESKFPAKLSASGKRLLTYVYSLPGQTDALSRDLQIIPTEEDKLLYMVDKTALKTLGEEAGIVKALRFTYNADTRQYILVDPHDNKPAEPGVASRKGGRRSKARKARKVRKARTTRRR